MKRVWRARCPREFMGSPPDYGHGCSGRKLDSGRQVHQALGAGEREQVMRTLAAGGAHAAAGTDRDSDEMPSRIRVSQRRFEHPRMRGWITLPGALEPPQRRTDQQ